jgi:hypothetical protein
MRHDFGERGGAAVMEVSAAECNVPRFQDHDLFLSLAIRRPRVNLA